MFVSCSSFEVEMKYVVTFDSVGYEVEAEDSVEALRLGRLLHPAADVKHQSCEPISEESVDVHPIMGRLGSDVRFLSNDSAPVAPSESSAAVAGPATAEASPVVTPAVAPVVVPPAGA